VINEAGGVPFCRRIDDALVVERKEVKIGCLFVLLVHLLHSGSTRSSLAVALMDRKKKKKASGLLQIDDLPHVLQHKVPGMQNLLGAARPSLGLSVKDLKVCERSGLDSAISAAVTDGAHLVDTLHAKISVNATISARPRSKRVVMLFFRGCKEKSEKDLRRALAREHAIFLFDLLTRRNVATLPNGGEVRLGAGLDHPRHLLVFNLLLTLLHSLFEGLLKLLAESSPGRMCEWWLLRGN